MGECVCILPRSAGLLFRVGYTVPQGGGAGNSECPIKDIEIGALAWIGYSCVDRVRVPDGSYHENFLDSREGDVRVVELLSPRGFLSLARRPIQLRG